MARTIGTSSRAQLLEQLAHRGRRHALVGAVDQRIGDVGVGGEEAGILAAEVERLLQEGTHGGEVVGRARARPGVVGGRAHLAPAGDEVRGHLDGPLVVAPGDADEARRRRSRGAGCRHRAARASSSLPSAGSVDLLVREPAKRGALPPARGGAALGHVGGLVPAEHRAGRAEVADLEQPALELVELAVGAGRGRGLAGLCRRPFRRGLGFSRRFRLGGRLGLGLRAHARGVLRNRGRNCGLPSKQNSQSRPTPEMQPVQPTP